MYGWTRTDRQENKQHSKVLKFTVEQAKHTGLCVSTEQSFCVSWSQLQAAVRQAGRLLLGGGDRRTSLQEETKSAIRITAAGGNVVLKVRALTVT